MLHIHLTTAYDGFTSTSNALTSMRNAYGTGNGWHFTSDQGYTPDLHHGLFGKGMGGGIAYLGVICNWAYGFGLSAGLTGAFESMDNAAVWDMYVVSFH